MKWLAVPSALLLCAAGEPCTTPLCNFDTLAPWQAKLATPGVAPIHVLQIGDSHTAGDAVTGGWRALLQAEAGSGGRGVLPPGRPYAGYVTRGVTTSMSPGWRIAATFGPGSADPRPPLGFAGFSLVAAVKGASMGLAADPAMAFDRFVLCAIAGPVARSVTVRTPDRSERIDLAAELTGPRCATVKWNEPQTAVEVIADDASVTITSWATFRDRGGVALSNLGIVGSQLVHLARTDDAVLTDELLAYAPDLIVLSFGTNEGFVRRIDADAYEAGLRAQIGRLQALAPGVPLLLLGPPDALSRQAALRGAGAVDCGGGLFAPPGLAQVRSVQRKVAGTMGLAWWDWQARMGGACSARRWVESGRMRADHVHFTTSGGAAIARLLQDDLHRPAVER